MKGNYAVIVVFWYVSTILLCHEVASQPEGDPFFENCPNDFKVEAYEGENNVNVSWTIPKAYSNSTRLHELDPTLEEPSMGPGSFFGVQVAPYDVVYVVDNEGKQAECRFSFEVVLSEPPIILNCPSDFRPSVVTKYNPGTLPLTIPPRPTFVDNSGDIEDGVESTLPMGAVEGKFYQFPVGVTRIRYVVSDKVGNNDTCEYTVENKIAPPANLWNISVGTYNSSCITLIWSLINEATQYNINHWRTIEGRADALTDPESVPGSDGNLFKQHSICSLFAGTQYTFEIESMSANYAITHRTRPSVPQDLTTITKPTSVKISWTNPDSSSLEQYHIFYHQENRPDAIVDLGYITKDMTSYSFESLAPSTMFIFYVEAVMGTGETRTSSVASIRESTDLIPRDIFVTVTNFTESTIRIAWLSIETADTVLLFINKEESVSEFQFYPVFTASPDYQSSFEFSNLKSLTSYNITLAINGENAVYKTITQKTRPGRVEISMVTTTTSSISLTWKGSIVGEYRIRVSPYHSPEELPIKIGQDKVTISDLTADTDYYVAIEYVRDVREGVASVPVRRILKTVDEEDGPLCDEPSLFLVIVTAGSAGMIVLILLVVICGLLCLIPCQEEDEIPPIPPATSYPNSRIGTLYNQTDTASIDIQMAAIRKAENLEAEEDPYSRMIAGRFGTGTATYKNVFGRKVKRKYSTKYQRRSTHGSSAAEPTRTSDAQRDSDNQSEASYEDVFQPEDQTRRPVSISQAVSRSFDALNNGPKNDKNRNTGLEGNRNSNSMGNYLGNAAYHDNIALSNTIG